MLKLRLLIKLKPFFFFFQKLHTLNFLIYEDDGNIEVKPSMQYFDIYSIFS